VKIQRLFILFILVLAACTPQPTASPVPVEEPTSTPLSAVPVPLDTPAITSTDTPEPTAVSAANTPDAKQQAQATLLPLVAPCDFADQPVSYSSRKTWLMVTCLGDKPEDGTTAKFFDVDSSQKWAISFKDEYITAYKPGDPNMSSLLQKSFIPAGWTKDEKFAYLAVQTSNEESPYKGYDALFRLDLSTGKLRPTLKPAIGPLATSYSFKFSPGGTMLAYFNQLIQPLTIIILNTGTGDETKFTLDAKFTQGGSFLWSPDEKKLIVSVLDQGANGGNSVIVFDLETKKNDYLVQQSPTVYLPVAWVDTTTIYAKSYPGDWVYLNTLTKEVTNAPAPTSTP
jgi:hypothetical protein